MRRTLSVGEGHPPVVIEPFVGIPPRLSVALAYITHCRYTEDRGGELNAVEITPAEEVVRQTALKTIDSYLRGETEYFAVVQDQDQRSDRRDCRHGS